MSSDATDLSITGVQIIKDYVTRLPEKPGVYRMLSEAGDVLYIGKAKSLKKRVISYTRIQALPIRIQRMVSATRSMIFVVTKTETEALLLEANLIKTMKPRYNVLLRDDKSFPYIRISDGHEAPRLLKHRGARKSDERFYGPFASAGAVNETINALQRAFMLRTCADNVYENRSRPCLQYQIKRCVAPCTGEIDLTAYRQLVEQVARCLEGRSREVQAQLQSAMAEASEALAFEKAALLRDRLASLAQVLSHQAINLGHLRAADVFGISQMGGRNCVEVFFYRSWQNWGNRSYFPRAGQGIDSLSVLGPFIAQFYLNKPIPRLILVPGPIEDQALLADALSEKAGHRVRILVPQKGEKRRIIDEANRNAKEALSRELTLKASQKSQLEGLQTLLNLDKPIKRIEVYDNSHHAGSAMVGAMVVSGEAGFAKQAYRKFNLKDETIAPGDDFAMMRHVLKRRFTRLLKENLDKETFHENDQIASDDLTNNDQVLPDWPDLILIDGGKGQLSAVKSIMDSLSLGHITLVAVSKGPDRNAGREVIHQINVQPVLLEENDARLYFIQRLRDEAHRFAIGAQRKRRTGAIKGSDLDDIPGIGQTRKRALLRHFGAVSGIKQAAMEDLCQVNGIDRRTAENIFNFFHET